MFILRSLLYFISLLGLLSLLVSATLDAGVCINAGKNCSQYAECKNTTGNLTCDCKPGYDGNGTFCTDIDECMNQTWNNCSANANCTNTIGSYNCTCKSGFEGNGTTCNDIDECMNQTWNNCSAHANCTNTIGSYNCTCKSGFEGNGTTCNDIDECMNQTWNNCSAHANCTNTIGSYNCTCKSGFEGNGTTCNDIDECMNQTWNNCSAHEDCRNTIGSYNCTCKSGFEGNGTTCNDIDEYSNKTLNKCLLNADCINENGTYRCKCKVGYKGNGTICNDIDECMNQTWNNCSAHANCTNTIGSYNCTCKSGFEGNGTTCNDIDECMNQTLYNCSAHEDCTNTIGSYNCTCKSGFEGNGTTCNDIDECMNQTWNNCSAHANCTNTIGSYNCTCKSGFEGNGTTCNDINECKNKILNHCSAHANCTNTIGSYNCTCKSGYGGNGTTCNDIDECSNSTMHVCPENASCNNTDGGYNCTCNSGFERNGALCTDIDECNDPTLYNCSSNSTCHNKNGSFECMCDKGYEKVGDICKDIDECKNSSLHHCSKHASCNNKEGGYSCSCKSGFEGNGTFCTDIDECIFPDRNNCSSLTVCKNTEGNFTCQCIDGYRKNGIICEDINECAENTSDCHIDANCTNVNGSYNCICKNGYRGDGKKCSQESLFDYTSAINTTKHDGMYGPYDMYGDIHAFGRYFSTVYVSQNGYISLGSDPQIQAQPLANYSFPKQVVIFAPFWAELDLSSKGKIFVDNYKNCLSNDKKKLSEIGKSIKNFQPRRALVITWKDVSPYPASEFGNETITFQAVLAANEKHLYVMFNYDTEMIHWNKAANERNILIGYLDGNAKFKNFASNTNIYKWLENTTQDFTGRRFTKNVGNSNENSMVCWDWFCEKEGQIPVFGDTTPCPCTREQAERDYTFHLKKNCYETAFAENQMLQKCCYDNKYGALLLGYPDGGYMYNKSAQQDMKMGWKQCCKDYKLCNLFYEIYPSHNCSKYQTPTDVLILEPLVFNFLNNQGSAMFYGSGEYNLISTSRLKLQARIEMQDNSVNPEILPKIPVYTAFAIKFDHDILEFLLNGTSISSSSSSSHSENVKVDKKSAHDVLVRTPIVQMKFMLNGTNFGAILFVPASKRSMQFGLMSSHLPNGTKFNNSPKNVYEAFKSWKVSSQNDSLFNYTSHKNFSVINSNEVDLKQFQEVITNLTQHLDNNKNKSKSICGQGKKHCELELLLKNTTTILNMEKSQTENQEILENFPPVFKGVSQSILVYKNILMKVHAEDPENGTVTIDLDTKLNNNTYQFEQDQFNWTLNDLTRPTYVKFFAYDSSKAASLYWPEVFLCTCNNKSECQKNVMKNKLRLRNSSNMSQDRMYRMPCDCREGYTGLNCDKMVHRCTNTTCYPNVACNSSKPGNPCESCPPGMAGDGIKCYDINQCSKGVCSQKCKDLLGSNYICSCWPGYVLAADNKTCLDIDECKSVNNCTKEGQYCENNNGSYSCKCKAGYLLKNYTCISLKGKNKVDGSLVFSSMPNTAQAWSEDLKNNSSPKFKALANIMKTSLLKVLPKDKSDILEVTSFEKVVSSQGRKKRSTSPDSIKGNYEVYGNNLNADQLKNSIQNSCQTPYCNLGGLSGVSSQSITVADALMCDKSPCDPESTRCTEKNGYQCVCKPGFENWPEYNGIRCKDINECALTTKPCGNVNCNNTVGSYTCVCDFGFVFKKATKECVDVCSGSVCNEGICIRNADDFRCGCNDGWSGDRCDVTDQQSEKRRTDLIVVASILGTFCFIFIVIIICCYCHYKSKKSGDFIQSDNSEMNWGGLPRARLREVELVENGNQQILTKSSNQYESLPGISNPAFEHYDSSVERC